MARGSGTRGGDSGDFKDAMIDLTKAIKDLSEKSRQQAQASSSSASRTPRFALEQGLAEPDPGPAAAPRGPLRGYRGHGDTTGSGDFGADLQGGPMGQLGGGILGAMPGLLASAGGYAAQKTPFGTTGNTDQLGQNLEMGLLKGITDIAKPVPVLGDYLQNQFKGLEEAVYAPEQRARGKLSPVFERMAMAGVDVSDQEMREAAQFAIPIERKAVYAKQRFERISAAVNADNGAAIGGALNSIGL